VDPLAVPDANLAVGTVPDDMLDAFNEVNEEPEPTNVVAVTTPDTFTPLELRFVIVPVEELTLNVVFIFAQEIVPALKSPELLRTTMVFDVFAVVPATPIVIADEPL